MESVTDMASISARALLDESEAMRTLLAQLPHMAELEAPIMAQAKEWTQAIRKAGAGHGVEAFLASYGLNTEEGVALMCLAEALLRIPDAHTADALIQDTFDDKHWEDYTHGGVPWLVGLSSWGLLLTGKVLDYGHDPRAGMSAALRKLVGKLGEPVIRQALKKAMRLIGGQFVLGETVEEAVANGEAYRAKGYRFSYDILGEGARSEAQALGYVQSYLAGIEFIGRQVAPGTALFDAPGISIKLSALHARYQLVKKERVLAELLPRLREIALAAKAAGVAIAIDAEEATRLDIEMVVFEALLADPAFDGWNGLGFVLQAYQKRGFYVIDWLGELAKKHKRVIPLRLVKGAYWDSEIKWAQLQGLAGYPVFTRKEHTDVSYLACADKILRRKDAFFPQFATHNARTIASIRELAKRYGATKYEFQRLHGMGEALHDLVVPDMPSRIYAPVGAHKDLLAYLIRRLLENGANSSFVHLLMDESKSPEQILADPIARAKQFEVQQSEALPKPEAIFGEARRNSLGMDFGNYVAVQQLSRSVAAFLEDALPDMAEDSVEAVQAKLENAHKTQRQWAKKPAGERAAILERAADLLEKNRDELVALLSKEAGKTLPDAISEIREAADFCRYYAAEARKLFATQNLTSPAGESNQLFLHARGVFACISPWNFPLAIFVGQVVVALVTGNAVIAKPARQTEHIALRAVELLHEAGVPREMLQLAIGPGGKLGALLTQSALVDGVVFTGSLETAQTIGRSLAARPGAIAPLIAETGGQNVMVVDSSALLEQAVDDIVLSAFGSAGQRCSALRVLFVQEDIADALLGLLAGAMAELKLGAPHEPDTDIGPVIDAGAKEALLTHIEKLKVTARLIAVAKLPDGAGHFVAPHAFEIRDIKQLTQEVFGPVLHVLRFKAGELEQVAQEINSTGYGLTFGLHSRIDSHVQLLAARVRAGNMYVNRSMIGATVGVQPFGGEGLSGTGPKAGGPYYLQRFVSERTLTINTAAIGGNVTLLSGR